MTSSMPPHTATSFAFQTDNGNHNDRPDDTHRSMPLHLEEMHSHAYSNVMPIESLIDFSHRNEKRRVVDSPPDHHYHHHQRKPDWRDSQRSDDSFSAYVEHRVIESTPQRHERERHVISPTQARDEDQYGRAVHDADEQDERNASWPSTKIDEGDAYDDEDEQMPDSLQASQQQHEDDDDDFDGDADLNGEKKRRRRTNKAEANVLASVFAQTQFPDAETREKLAKRLNMKAKAVSIWFQNRRQAMKKRASRFGGVEGVNGPTVTAATMQVFDVNGLSQDHHQQQQQQQHREAEGLSADRLKRWMSFGDLTNVEIGSQHSIVRQSASQPEMITLNSTRADETSKINLSSAPILDLICRQRGKQQLSRMASLPSLASVISSKGEEKDTNKKDLRDLLPSIQDSEKLPLNRATSLSSLAARLLQEGRLPVLQERQTRSNETSRARKQSVDLKEVPNKCVLLQGKVTFPVTISQEDESVLLGRKKEIWQRMQSSSSSSDGVHSSPDSNKENRDPNESKYPDKEGEDENEDEEKTLRLIAGRRAAKEQAKKEKKLSEEGKRYLQEADARVALQQKKKRASLGNQQLAQSILGKGLPSEAHRGNRSWNRAVSEAHVLTKRRDNLARIPSLDMTAGRDRAQEDGHNKDLRAIIEHRMAKRLQARNQDENAILSMQQKRRPKQSNGGQQRHSSRKSPYTRMPLQAVKNGTSITRSFVPSHSMPDGNLMSKYSSAHSHGLETRTPRYDASRESKTRLDGQVANSLPSSQEGSENGSDEWLEAWARERRKELQYTVTPVGKGLRERSAGILNSQSHRLQSSPTKYNLNKRQSGAVLQPTPRHDDSGFYGSDSDDGNYDGILRSSKRRLLSQDNSSSPIKRSGDERDRLAAETLLGLGSRS